jgi:integrase
MSRRPRGTGSVYQRNDGYWVVSVTVAGKRINRYCKTQREAQEVLATLLVDQRHGLTPIPSKLTLAQWIDKWFEINQSRLRPSTLKTYHQVLAPVCVLAGKSRLDKLTPLQLTAVFTKLERQGMGRRRSQLAHGYLKRCLQDAVSLDVMNNNPMLKVKRPQWVPAEKQYWTIEQAQIFIGEGLRLPGRYAPLFVLLTTTGLRISEALGLRWTDVDLKQRVIHIQRAAVLSVNKHSVLPTKTKAGNRDVTLTASAISALSRLPRPIDASEYVFRTSTGSIPKQTDLRRYLDRLTDLAGVPRINVHGLRHVAAMLALEATQDPYLVQRRLGHIHVNTTLGIYGYPSRKESIVAAAVDDLLALHPMWESV